MDPKERVYKATEWYQVQKCSSGISIKIAHFWHREIKKISFLRISQEISILEHMLLHKSYINMAIANILVYSKSLHDLPRPRYKKCAIREWQGNGRGHMGVMLNFSELSPGLNLFFRPLRTSVQSGKMVPQFAGYIC